MEQTGLLMANPKMPIKRHAILCFEKPPKRETPITTFEMMSVGIYIYVKGRKETQETNKQTNKKEQIFG
jgi:hypothetical protein